MLTHDQREWDPARHSEERLNEKYTQLRKPLSLHSSVERSTKIQAILENQRQQNTTSISKGTLNGRRGCRLLYTPWILERKEKRGADPWLSTGILYQQRRVTSQLPHSQLYLTKQSLQYCAGFSVCSITRAFHHGWHLLSLLPTVQKAKAAYRKTSQTKANCTDQGLIVQSAVKSKLWSHRSHLPHNQTCMMPHYFFSEGPF